MLGPNLLVVGAMRSGTTSVYRYLSQHPDIFMTHPVKEPTFLAFTEEQADFQGPGDDALNGLVPKSVDGYMALFEDGQRHRYRGEASATYLYLPSFPAGMHAVCPDAHCVVILRDPVERAHSSYQYLRSRGMETLSSFREGLAAEPKRIAAGWAPMWHYATAGDYLEQVARLVGAVPPDRLHFLRYEDLAAHGGNVLAPLIASLGLPHVEPTEDQVVHNRSGRSRFPVVEKLLTSSPTKRRLKSMLPHAAQRGVYTAMRRLDRWRSTQMRPQRDLPQDVAQALRERYSQEVGTLEELTGLDLRSWFN